MVDATLDEWRSLTAILTEALNNGDSETARYAVSQLCADKVPVRVSVKKKEVVDTGDDAAFARQLQEQEEQALLEQRE